MNSLIFITIDIPKNTSMLQAETIFNAQVELIRSQLDESMVNHVIYLPSTCEVQEVHIDDGDMLKFHIDIGNMSPSQANDYINRLKNSLTLPVKSFFFGVRPNGEKVNDVWAVKESSIEDV